MWTFLYCFLPSLVWDPLILTQLLFWILFTSSFGLNRLEVFINALASFQPTKVTRPHCRDLPYLVSQEEEMTRLWDNTLGSGKQDMMSYLGHKEEVRSRAPQADRPRWAQPVPSGSWVRTEAQGFRQEICPLKAGTLGLLLYEILVLVCFPPRGF